MKLSNTIVAWYYAINIVYISGLVLQAQTLQIHGKGSQQSIKTSDIRSIKFDGNIKLFSSTSSSVTSVEFLAVDSITFNTISTTSYKGSITKGIADSVWVDATVTKCNDPRTQFTLQRTGRIKDANGVSWIVPAQMNTNAKILPDLYNDCTGSGNADTSKLETIIIDPDGVIITAYIHADNYFEMYVNGTLIGRDLIAFTPFNSSIVRFKAKYPITYAFKCVDGEEHLGVGMEYDTYNLGDAGIVAYFSDGTKTDESWRAQVYYIAPLDNPNCVIETADGIRNAINCTGGGVSKTKPICAANKTPGSCYALHYPIPDGWEQKNYDDTKWPLASVFTEAQFGPKEAYTNFRTAFKDAKFIWTNNLILDNLVLLRKTVNK